MNKSIAKEIIIGLLLCLAILLVLSVILYSYIPNNKVIPEVVSYTTPEEAKDVLKEAQADTSKVIMTYEVNGNELSTAQKTNSYKAGKVNPFSTYKPEETATGSTTGSASNSGNSNGGTTSDNSSNGTTENTNNGGTNSDGSSSTRTTTNSKSSNEGNSSNSSTNGGTYYKNKGTK